MESKETLEKPFNKHKNEVNFGFLIVVFLLGFLLAQAAGLDRFFGVHPYTNVERVQVEWEKDSTDLLYTFRKNEDCVLKDFVVVGYSFDIPTHLSYTNLDEEFPDTKLFDRLPGEQALHISVGTKDEYYQRIEIKTRHLCTLNNGEETSVSKVFANIER